MIEKTNRKVDIKEDIYKEYYRVSGLNKIKFMIYNFEQEMIVEMDNQKKENKSEVENIIINYKLKLPTVIDKDGNDPSIKVNKLLLKYSNKDIPKEKLIRVNSSSSQTQDEQKLKKQKESCRKLKTELNKKDKEALIIIFFILCFFLNFILSKLYSFRQNISLIVYASLLRYYTNLGIYHTRKYTVTKINIT